MKLSIKRVQINIERVELKYWDKDLLQSHILTTIFPRWNIFETNSFLHGQSLANTPLSHGTASLDVRFHWFL